MTSLNSTENKIGFLTGGGHMAEYIRRYSWETTPLGPVKDWPQSLKTTLSILNRSRSPMLLCWGKKTIIFANDAYLDNIGHQQVSHNLTGKIAAEIWPEEWANIAVTISKLFSGIELDENELIFPFGRYTDLRNSEWSQTYCPVIDESDNTAGILITYQETPDKKEILNNLFMSQQRFEKVLKDSPIGIIALLGDEYIIEVVNTAYSKLVGKNVAELCNQPLFTVLPEAEEIYRPIIERVRHSCNPLFLNESPYHFFENGQRKDGFLNLVYQPYQNLDGAVVGVMVLCHDVTEQVMSRMAIETALEKVSLSKEAAKLGTFDLDVKNGILEWDKRCRILFGISHDDVVTYEKDFVNGLHPDDAERIISVIDNLYNDKNSDGDYDVEYRTVGVEDKRLRWVRAKGRVFYDKNHLPIRFIGSVHDITKAKMEEFRRNDFVGIVSHELKTPLTSLNGILQVAENKLSGHDDKFLSEAMSKAIVQVKKMKNLITSFLDLSKYESGKIQMAPIEFRISDLIREVFDELNFITPGQILLDFCEEVVVLADRDKIGSVMTNFLTNALKYSPKGKPVSISCKQVDNEIVISVKDEGFGINEQDIKNIFERYYRVDNAVTKHVSGFGIGLYLSAEIVKLHNGRIWAESKPGNGSTFYFALPK